MIARIPARSGGWSSTINTEILFAFCVDIAYLLALSRHHATILYPPINLSIQLLPRQRNKYILQRWLANNDIAHIHIPSLQRLQQTLFLLSSFSNGSQVIPSKPNS